MSYFIFYEEQFIKVKNKYIPLIIGGDNNVYEGYSKRRLRDWTSFTGSSKVFHSEKEILDFVERVRNSLLESDRKRETPEYNDESFGYYAGMAVKGKHTSGTTFNDFKNIAKRGIKFALTLEELWEKFQVFLKIEVVRFKEGGDYLGTDFFGRVYSTEELITSLKQVSEQYKDDCNFYPILSLNCDESMVKKIRKAIKESNQIKNVGDNYFVVSV